MHDEFHKLAFAHCQHLRFQDTPKTLGRTLGAQCLSDSLVFTLGPAQLARRKVAKHRSTSQAPTAVSVMVLRLLDDHFFDLDFLGP